MINSRPKSTERCSKYDAPRNRCADGLRHQRDDARPGSGRAGHRLARALQRPRDRRQHAHTGRRLEPETVLGMACDRESAVVRGITPLHGSFGKPQQAVVEPPLQSHAALVIRPAAGRRRRRWHGQRRGGRQLRGQGLDPPLDRRPPPIDLLPIESDLTPFDRALRERGLSLHPFSSASLRHGGRRLQLQQSRPLAPLPDPARGRATFPPIQPGPPTAGRPAGSSCHHGRHATPDHRALPPRCSAAPRWRPPPRFARGADHPIATDRWPSPCADRPRAGLAHRRRPSRWRRPASDRVSAPPRCRSVGPAAPGQRAGPATTTWCRRLVLAAPLRA